MSQYKYVKDKFETMKTERSNFDVMYQVLGEYISLIKQNFQGQPAKGEFLTDRIYDATAVFAAQNAASSILGLLWPGTAKQAIELIKPDDMDESTDLDKFYEDLTNITVRAMDDPKANLVLALDEYMLDQLIFGTSGVGVEKGARSKLFYKSHGVKVVYLDEGQDGIVDTIALFYEWEPHRVVAEYGENNVSEKTRKAAASNSKEPVQILIMIQPRKEKKAQLGKLSMTYESIHLEYSTCSLLREEGFHELPIAMTRFKKVTYEKQGRSLGMNAIADIKEANILRESYIVAVEKNNDMPLGVMDDGILGGGYIDTSARAVNVFNASANIGNSPPVFEIGTKTDLSYLEARLQKLEETIAKHFGLDRLLDFNNDTQMTFGEAQIREQIRMSSLIGLFARQLNELFTPLVERTVNILWRMGEFGVIKGSIEEEERIEQGLPVTYLPDAIQDRLKKGEEVYNINYKTKAANASKAEEYIAIIDVMTFASQAITFDPSIMHRIDLHEAIKKLGNIRALPAGIIRADDKVEELMQQEQERMQQQQELASAQQMAETYQSAAKGDSLLK